VRFGESNFEYFEVLDGIHPGEEVIISDMDDKMHLQKIKVKE
jgi:HlyD family secretion protein